MLSPSWLGDILAAAVLATAGYCTLRLAVALLRGRVVAVDADVTHVLMGVAMAGMFVSALSILNPTVWELVFAALAAWYVARTAIEARGAADRWSGLRHHGGHLAAAGAMIYMFLALPAAATDSVPSASAEMSGTSMGAGVPTLALLFAVLLFGYAVVVADRITLTAEGAVVALASGSGHGPTGYPAGLLAPRAAAGCEVVMSVAMGFMLIAML